MFIFWRQRFSTARARRGLHPPAHADDSGNKAAYEGQRRDTQNRRARDMDPRFAQRLKVTADWNDYDRSTHIPLQEHRIA